MATLISWRSDEIGVDEVWNDEIRVATLHCASGAEICWSGPRCQAVQLGADLNEVDKDGLVPLYRLADVMATGRVPAETMARLEDASKWMMERGANPNLRESPRLPKH